MIGQLVSAIEKNLRMFLVRSRWLVARTDQQQRNARLVHEILMSGFYAKCEKGIFSLSEAVAQNSLNTMKTVESVTAAMGLISMAQV